MDKTDFRYKESGDEEAGTYETNVKGFKTEIPEYICSEEKIEFAERVIEIYGRNYRK